MKRAAEIDGWMMPEELLWLYEQSRKYPCVVELGSWKGRSSSALVQAKEDEGVGMVWCVDTWKGSSSELDSTHQEATEKDIYKEWQENLAGSQRVQAMRMTTLDAAEALQFKVDMVFVDAEHTYESVSDDLAAWEPKVKKGGLMCGHDWNFPSVRLAVVDYFVPRGMKIELVEGTQIWMVRKEN